MILYNVVKLFTSPPPEKELYINNVLFNGRVTTNTMISTCLEYGLGREASVKDVYSFGTLLLEIFTRRPPTESMFNKGLRLHEFGKRALPEKVMKIVDPSQLPLEEVRANNGRVRNEECLVAVIKTGVVSSVEFPFERMEMTEVVARLCMPCKADFTWQEDLIIVAIWVKDVVGLLFLQWLGHFFQY